MLPAMSSPVVCPCPSPLQHAALELVLGDVSPEQRGALIDTLRPLADQGVDVFSGLAVAESKRRVTGACWLQPQVGKTSTLWPPAFAGKYDPHLAERLASQSLEAAHRLPIELAQVLLDGDDDRHVRWAESLGFDYLADLLYLVLTVPPVPGASAHQDPLLELDAPALAHQPLLEELIQATYVGTQDCPGLEGRRNIVDTLAGYQSVGRYHPQLWWIVRWRGEPAGVLLVAPYPDAVQWELVYMGVTPRFRGQALGSKILHRLRRLASEAGINQVVLAVDSSNTPALRMYQRCGFVEWARRIAYVKSIVGKGPS